jgi:predicted O-methyltransferase YrrM
LHISADKTPRLDNSRIELATTLQGRYLDFRAKSVFTRFDECKFVKCTLLIGRSTEQLAFTRCVFQDCNIGSLERDEERGLYARDNLFEAPLEQRRAEFEKRLAQALATRRAETASPAYLTSVLCRATRQCQHSPFLDQVAGLNPSAILACKSGPTRLKPATEPLS